MLRVHLLSASVAVSLLSAVPAAAHHSASVAYDISKTISVNGVISQVRWENPHTFADGKSIKP
jgi:hypothetical protein